METSKPEILNRTKGLRIVLKDCGKMTIAVSGGVDSMTLSSFAHRNFGRGKVRMVHAVSPAVPKAATSRVKTQSASEGWELDLVDAGEFTDESYLSNPFNRCFFCKNSLYQTLSENSWGTLVSGTNSDDLQDFRPGLKAAEEFRVRHPYVEAGFTKDEVRVLAGNLGLPELSRLPASPCLSSRVETGIRIDASDLGAIDEAESWMQQKYAPKTVRCRVLEEGIMIQLDLSTLERLDLNDQQETVVKVRDLFRHRPETRIRFAPYRRGSTFLIPSHHP